MKQFKEISEVINNIIKSLGIETKLQETNAVIYWPEIVGPDIAKNTKAQQVKDGKLFVKVKNDVWRNELSFLKGRFIEKLNSKIGNQVISDIILL